jgi:hypothetical protein
MAKIEWRPSGDVDHFSSKLEGGRESKKKKKKDRDWDIYPSLARTIVVILS